MASGIDPAPSTTPSTDFEPGFELISSASYATECSSAGEKMAESVTESAESFSPSAPAAEVSVEMQGRVLREQSSITQGSESRLDLMKSPKVLA